MSWKSKHKKHDNCATLQWRREHYGERDTLADADQPNHRQAHRAWSLGVNLQTAQIANDATEKEEEKELLLMKNQRFQLSSFPVFEQSRESMSHENLHPTKACK